MFFLVMSVSKHVSVETILGKQNYCCPLNSRLNDAKFMHVLISLKFCHRGHSEIFCLKDLWKNPLGNWKPYIWKY